MSSPPTLHRTAHRAAVHTRPASVRDYPAIRRIISAAYAQYEVPLGVLLYRRYLADLLDIDRHARDGQLIVAEVGGLVRGSGAFYPDSSLQGLGWPSGWAGGRALAVHPAARRDGVARALLAACERLARENQTPVFAFHTASVMTGAITLYERLGYCRAPEFDQDLATHFAVAPGRRVLALAYRRDLAETDVLLTCEPSSRIGPPSDTTPQTQIQAHAQIRNAS
jgi:ribosomal protein S18 acetylase RimI-like enzyme